MKSTSKIAWGKNSGVALIYAVMVAFVSASFVSVMLNFSISSNKDATVKRYRTRAQYLAEAAIESAKKSIQTTIANYSTPTLNVANNITVDGSPVTYTLTQPVSQWITTQPSGIQTIINQYQVTAIATVQGYKVTARRLINAQATPIFQFAVFYTNDLEIHPGPNMTLGGRVHSNGNMHLGSDATLTINTNYLRSVGNMYRTRKDEPTMSDGTVQIRKWVADPFNTSEPVSYVNMNSKSQMSAAGVSTVGGYDHNFTTGYDKNNDGDFVDSGDFLPWTTGALAYWKQPSGYAGGTGNTVMSSEHGVTEAVAPEVKSIKMFDATPNGTGGNYKWDNVSKTYVPATPGTGTHNKGFFHGQAGLTILRKPDNTIEVKNSSGQTVTLPANTVTVSTMYDARQANGAAGNIPTLEIDVGKLMASSYYPANGLLYTARYGENTGLNAGGILLKNGSDLKNHKLTVVSEDPVYVKGDYNTVNKKGAAVIGDSVNLLSNNWGVSATKIYTTNTSSPQYLPTATATTYNAAMISGNQNSSAGVYNGGLENLPRFHENWSGINCNISGSFVNMWLSQYGTSGWVYGANRYTAPNRNWNYETSFNNINNLPPFTPMAVSAVDVVSW